MAYSTVDTVGGTISGDTSLTPTTGDATTGDDVFVHVVWTNTGITIGDVGDWTIVGTALVGPDYVSALYHHTLDGTDDLVIDWTTSSDCAWQLIGCGGLDASPVDLNSETESNSAATLARLSGVSTGDHILCFAGCVNVLSKDLTRAYPDVGFITAEATESNSGFPTLWVGQFSGPVGDLDTTFPASVYFDPPPTHSIGRTVSVAVA